MGDYKIVEKNGEKHLVETGIFGDVDHGELHQNFDKIETRNIASENYTLTQKFGGDFEINTDKGREGTLEKTWQGNYEFNEKKPEVSNVDDSSNQSREYEVPSSSSYDASYKSSSSPKSTINKKIKPVKEENELEKLAREKDLTEIYPFTIFAGEYLDEFEKMKHGKKMMELTLIKQIAILDYIAKSDEDSYIRRIAARRLDKEELYVHMSKHDKDPEVRLEALQSIENEDTLKMKLMFNDSNIDKNDIKIFGYPLEKKAIDYLFEWKRPGNLYFLEELALFAKDPYIKEKAENILSAWGPGWFRTILKMFNLYG